MSQTPKPTFAGRLADECHDAARRLDRLQHTLGPFVSAVGPGPALLRDVQTLDGVQQMLTDMAALFDQLAVEERGPLADVPEAAVNRVRQATFQARLRGEAGHAPGPDPDIFDL
ncbi:hypothetical protein [Jannaschia marina]|uniref:hypothetical protein n=1 Tax=Jannaschia marina TaxID=2741674 RepID=UPI0015CE724A|nr:hypothetical protein [Jannaschia marina]